MLAGRKQPINDVKKSKYSTEELEDTKEVIIIRISKKNRQNNDQQKRYKGTNNDLQNIHIKLKIEEHEPIQFKGDMTVNST